jgi:hypothetical protein
MSETRTNADLGEAYTEFTDWLTDQYMPAFISAVEGASDAD